MDKEILTIMGWNYDKFEEEFEEDINMMIVSKNIYEIITQDLDQNDIQLLFESSIAVSDFVKDSVIMLVSETNFREIQFELN